MDDSDAYLRAKRVLEEYGSDAMAHASQQAARMLEHDDFHAFGLWKRIAHAIVQIRTAERHGKH